MLWHYTVKDSNLRQSLMDADSDHKDAAENKGTRNELVEKFDNLKTFFVVKSFECV